MAEAGTPAPSAPAQPESGAASTGNPRTDSQARIDQLVRQKNELKRQLETEGSKLREELAELRGKVSATAPAPANPKSWDQMSDDQLDSAGKWARDNDNGASLDAVYAERARREARKAADEAVIRTKREIAAEQAQRDTQASILRDFGPDAFDPESPLYQKADEFMGRIIRAHGKEHASTPMALRAAFLEAERATKTLSERDRSKSLEAENAALKERATLMERGGSPAGMASRPNDAVQAALAKNDKKGAIKALKFVQAMAGQARSDALKSRG
jgi:hypothetical protein